jgi:cobalt-precorrin 5A hydrolase
MDLGQAVGAAVIVAGVGCRKGATAAAVAAAIETALARAGIASADLAFIATAARKGEEPGIVAAARAIGVPLVFVAQRDLEAAGAHALSSSALVMALAGVPSVAEAAALAAGGTRARLIAPRIAVGPATCALAEGGIARAAPTESVPSGDAR